MKNECHEVLCNLKITKSSFATSIDFLVCWILDSWSLFLVAFNYIPSFSRQSWWLWRLTSGISPTGCWRSPSVRRQKTSSSILSPDSFAWLSWTWRRASWQCYRPSRNLCQRLFCFSQKFSSPTRHRTWKRISFLIFVFEVGASNWKSKWRKKMFIQLPGHLVNLLEQLCLTFRVT